MQPHKADSLVNGPQPGGPRVQLTPRGRIVQDDRIPEVPHLPDGYQNAPNRQVSGGLQSHPVRLDKDQRLGKGDHAPTLTRFLSRTKLVSYVLYQRGCTDRRHDSSNKGQIKAIIRVDDFSEPMSSGNESASSSSESKSTRAKPSLPPAYASPQSKATIKRESVDQMLESYDLDAPVEDGHKLESLEVISELLFSAEHLRTIFADPSSLLKFTLFLGTYRPRSVPTLIYYLDATKALKAISYANAIASGLEPVSGQGLTPIATRTVNSDLEEKAE
ncbi:MAG: hypothetical protein Q9187_007951, partial [Circinaria calcarea]